MVGDKVSFLQLKKLVYQRLMKAHLQGSRAGRANAVTHFNLVVKIRQWLRGRAIEVNGEREPKAQTCNVYSEFSIIDAIDVRLDNVQLALIHRFVVYLPGLEEALTEIQQLVHHAKQIRSRAARRIADGNTAKRIEYGLSVMDVVRLVLIDEAFYGGFLLAGHLCLQVALECLTAHEADDWLGGVVTSAVVPPGHQFLEYLPQHLRVNCDFNIERRTLRNGEVESLKKAAGFIEDLLVRCICDPDLGVVILSGLLEEAAVEVLHFPNGGFDSPALSLKDDSSLLVVKGREQELQAVFVEILSVLLQRDVGGPERGKVVRAAVNGEPALLLDESQEHEAVEQALGEEVAALLFFVAGAEPLDGVSHDLKDALVLLVEILCDLGNIEGKIMPVLNLLGLDAKEPSGDLLYIQHGDTLDCRSQALLWADGDAPVETTLLGILPLDIDEVEVGLRLVREDEEGIWVMFEELGDNGALVGQFELIGRKLGVDDVELPRRSPVKSGVLG